MEHHESHIFDEFICLEFFRYHYAWWMRKFLKNITPIFADISRCPNSVTVPIPQKIWSSPYHHISWSPAPVCTIKVNKDVSFNSSTDQWGIGDIFQDDQGNPLLHFRKQVVVDLTIHVEILTLREGFLVAVAPRWAHSTHFLFELDSSNAVLLLSQPVTTHWHFQLEKSFSNSGMTFGGQ